MKEKRYYIAYGSNLNVPQMRMRCPHATILGTANLKNWELLFKGSKTGSYLTIEECEGGTVPVVIWEVTATDEAALDRYEGFPNFYYKRDIRLQYKGIRTEKRRTVTAFAYIMHEDRPIGIPSNLYMRICLEGYDTFCFDKNVLVDAYDKCREVCGYEGSGWRSARFAAGLITALRRFPGRTTRLSSARTVAPDRRSSPSA